MSKNNKGNNSVTQELITAAAVGTVKVASFGIDMWYSMKAVSQAVTQQVQEYNDHKKNQQRTISNVKQTPSHEIADKFTKQLTTNAGEVSCKCGTFITPTKNIRCPSCNEYYTIINNNLMVECSKCNGKRLIKNAIGAHICNMCDGQGLVPYQQNPQGTRDAAKNSSQKQLKFRETWMEELERKTKK